MIFKHTNPNEVSMLTQYLMRLTSEFKEKGESGWWDFIFKHEDYEFDWKNFDKILPLIIGRFNKFSELTEFQYLYRYKKPK